LGGKWMNNNLHEPPIIEVYTDANEFRACIAIEKPEKRTEKERIFKLIIIEKKVNNLFEAEAVRLASKYVPENSNIKLFCDKEGDLKAIKTGKARRPNLKAIIGHIRLIEYEKNLTVDYQYVKRKNNPAGRILNKIRI